MIETELKILLDDAAEAALRARPLLRQPGAARSRPQQLVSIYFDAEDGRLAAAGIALRVRKLGRRWVQTLKRAGAAPVAGLSLPEEEERPVPGPNPVLEGGPLAGAAAEILAGAPLRPRFETRVRRETRLLAREGGTVELAIDHGEIRAGDRSAPIREAELELKSGGLGALYDAAEALFPEGPIRFAPLNKAARGVLLAEGGTEASAPAPRSARRLRVAPGATIETFARDVLRECLDQIAANVAATALTADPEGPHQLRIGLRRLRTACRLLRDGLGREALAPLAAEARDLARRVGALRDLDVLALRLADPAAFPGLADPARGALRAALGTRRGTLRAALARELSGPATTRFVLGLARFTETRGWLRPEDWAQSARLAAPVAPLAPALLARLWRRARARGHDIADMSDEARHDLRKDLKTLRYAAEFLRGFWRKRETAEWLKALRALQDRFGDLADARMMAELLAGPDRPAPGDPEVQHAAGWILGHLAARVEAGLPALAGVWADFRDARPFWERHPPRPSAAG